MHASFKSLTAFPTASPTPYPTAYPTTAVEVAGYPPAEGGAPPPAYPMPSPDGAGAAGDGTEGVVLVMGESSKPRTSVHANHGSM